jgi:hypothetical protein
MPWINQAFQFANRYVLLTEGPADKVFFQKLVESRGLPPFDAPYPVIFDKESAPEEARGLRGVGQIRNMLIAINTYLNTFAQLRQQLLLVIVAVDSGNLVGGKEWPHGFYNAAKEIRKAKGFGVPTGPLQIVQPTANPSIPIAIMAVPGSKRAGGLETLYSEALYVQYPGIEACVKRYFRAVPTRPNSWGAEKIGKARFQCVVSVTQKDNPALPPSSALSSRDNKSPLIEIADASFDDLEADLRVLCKQVGLIAG